jgi:hypothetical protein
MLNLKAQEVRCGEYRYFRKRLNLCQQAEEISTQKEVDVPNQQVKNLMNKLFLFKYSTNKFILNLTPK